MKKQNSRWKYIVLAALVLGAWILIFYKNLSYDYALRGETFSVFAECYTNALDYEVAPLADGGNGKYFEKKGDDPQLYLDLSKKQELAQIGGLELVLTKVFDANYEMDVQVFYRKAGEAFSEKHSVKTKLAAWGERVFIPLPLDCYEELRLDIDGAFELHEVNVCSEKMRSRPYISDATINRCLWYFPAVLVGFSLIFWAHGSRNSTWKTILFGAEPSPKRKLHWDYIRILAAVLVILAHACSPMVTVIEETGGADWKRLVLVCGLTLGLTCNLLYVMLSGALLLNVPKDVAETENIVSFYIRRASKIIIPLVAYYLFLLSLNHEVSFLPPKNLGTALKRIMTGAPDAAPHLWLIYTIVALYLVTPFFRVMAVHLSDKMLHSLMVLIFVLNALTNYLPLFGMNFGAATVLAGWEGVFLMGYILTRRNALPREDGHGSGLVFAGIAGFVIAVVVVFGNSANMNYVYNNTLPLFLMACGIFELFLKNSKRFAVKSGSRFGMLMDLLVRMCSKYSYSIILIHWYVLFVVVQGKMHVTALRFGCIGGIVATVTLTFVVCLIMAIVFDNTVVIVCSVLFDKACEKIMNTFEKYRVK